jgi:hypothetical protein
MCAHRERSSVPTWKILSGKCVHVPLREATSGCLLTRSKIRRRRHLNRTTQALQIQFPRT